MSKLIKKLRRFLDRDYQEQLEKREKLRKILSGMRKQQKAIEARLDEESDPALQAELRRKVLLLKEQRRKGLDLLHGLRGSS